MFVILDLSHFLTYFSGDTKNVLIVINQEVMMVKYINEASLP